MHSYVTLTAGRRVFYLLSNTGIPVLKATTPSSASFSHMHLFSLLSLGLGFRQVHGVSKGDILPGKQQDIDQI